MSTGDPICTVCGNYRNQCSCSSVLRTMLVKEAIEPIFESEDSLERLKSKEVAYMEVKEGGFSCKKCISLKEGFCRNPKIKTEVSPNGCCNLFIPFPENKVNPKEWKLK